MQKKERYIYKYIYTSDNLVFNVIFINKSNNNKNNK